MDDDTFFAAFRAGQLEPARFDHRAHLRAAFCALDRMPFLEACIAIRDGLRRLAAAAGRPALYHETVTVAFMALCADAREEHGTTTAPIDVDALVARHPALCDRNAIGSRYSDTTLASDSARRRFRLPDAGPGAPAS